MLDAISKYNILFLDIETVSKVRSYDDLDEKFKQLWQRKQSTLFKNEEVSFEEGFEQKAAIYAEFGKIVCISCGYITKEEGVEKLRVKSFYGKNEMQILDDFAKLLKLNYSDFQNQTLCGHNIKEFDIPYICRRMLINGIDLPDIINIHGKKPWEVNFIDTLQLWKFGDYKAYTSLNLLAALFEIPTPKDDIDGSMVGKVFWIENDINRIKNYCEKDVLTSVRLFQKLKNEDFIIDENVQLVE